MYSESPASVPNVEVRNLTKRYPDVQGAVRLARAMFKGDSGGNSPRPAALEDVTFSVPAGNTLGIIGLNGSGKSTLLQILAGVMKPTRGLVRVRAPLGALLELGAGFNPDCTGRENVATSAAIYGYTSLRLEELTESVMDFADIGDFFDQPLRTYSSGMRARLAFALTLQSRPRVLLVDEILSVGDIAFQAKCFRHFEQLRAAGTSLVIVSHDLGAIRMLCDYSIALARGRIQFQGDPVEVTESYTRFVQAQTRSKAIARGRPTADHSCQFTHLQMVNTEGDVIEEATPGQAVRFAASIRLRRAVAQPVVNLVLRTLEGMIIYSYSTVQDRVMLPSFPADTPLPIQIGVHLNLAPGPYTISVGLACLDGDDLLVVGGSSELSFSVGGTKAEFGVVHLAAVVTVGATHSAREEA